jgi:AICAR transformylase/IMP cyclohydrolase PurH
MLRSAAKNHADVTVICDLKDADRDDSAVEGRWRDFA